MRWKVLLDKFLEIALSEHNSVIFLSAYTQSLVYKKIIIHVAANIHVTLIDDYSVPKNSHFESERIIHCAEYANLVYLSHVQIQEDAHGLMPVTYILNNHAIVESIHCYKTLPAHVDPSDFATPFDSAQDEQKASPDRSTPLRVSGVSSAHALISPLSCKLMEPGARCDIRVINLSSHTHNKITSEQHHHASNTESRIHIKSLVTGHARTLYEGIIRIPHGLSSITARQQFQALMFDNAQAHASPQLEILSSDVHCAHGSALGYINEEHLMYMMSRGLSRPTAVKYVKEGFVNELLQVCTHKEWLHTVQSALTL